MLRRKYCGKMLVTDLARLNKKYSIVSLWIDENEL